MKRPGALRRTVALVASPPPRRRPDPAWSPSWRRAVVDVKARSGGRCEARATEDCLRVGEHRHHIWLRSRGGPDEAWNLLNVCHRCHAWIHANPAESTARGFMRSAWSGGAEGR